MGCFVKISLFFPFSPFLSDLLSAIHLPPRRTDARLSIVGKVGKNLLFLNEVYSIVFVQFKILAFLLLYRLHVFIIKLNIKLDIT